ncbi:MAG TPA: hypothetical protein VHW03_00255 [Chthoniobacterales bacterium]|jgi:hypothetical protein|nr:hypothetical protein [Chthoniobacterales bacterium]
MQNFLMRSLFVRGIFAALIISLLASCATTSTEVQEERLTMARNIAAEPPGNYFIGHRYARPPYHFWGYVRRPGQPWSTAQLVVFNENKKLAPDRAQMNLGFDDNYEYKLQGYFSGDKVYEVASNSVLPEFVLTGYELISTHPAPIFPSQVRGRRAGPLQIEKPL